VTDPNLVKTIGVTDEELRLTNHFLAASIASLEYARHFAAGSPISASGSSRWS